MCISRFCVLEQVIVESEFNSSTAVLTRFWTIWFATFATNAIFIQRNTILEIVTTFGSRIMSVPFTPEDKKYTITNRYLFFSISDTYNGSLWHISKQASGVSALATLIRTPVHLIIGFFSWIQDCNEKYIFYLPTRSHSGRPPHLLLPEIVPGIFRKRTHSFKRTQRPSWE